MSERALQVVTGAYGYSGKYIASRLLEKGHQVRTLTNSINRDNPFGEKVEARPYYFDDRGKLVESLRGASVFYNTYWVRFDYGDFDHSTAVENTFKLFDACRQAGRQPEQEESENHRGSHAKPPRYSSRQRCANDGADTSHGEYRP
jgi:NADH dehydrogenase